MKMSPAEEVIVSKMSEAPEKLWTVEELGDLVYEGRDRPKYWQASIRQTMRILALKSSYDVVRISRASGLGRGQKAEYKAIVFKKKKG